MFDKDGLIFALSGDLPLNAKNHDDLKKCVYPPSGKISPPILDEIRLFCEKDTRNLLKKYNMHVIDPKSGNAGGMSLEADVVRDIFALAGTHVTAAMFALPVKSEENPLGIYADSELYGVLIAMFTAVFFDADIAQSFKLRTLARQLAQQLGQLVLLNAKVVQTLGHDLEDGLIKAADSLASGQAKGQNHGLAKYGNHMIQRMLAAGKTVEEAVWGSMMPLICAVASNVTRLLAQCLDYYLGDGKQHLPELRRLANEDTPKANQKLMN